MTRTPDEIKKGLEQDEIDEALRKVRFADVTEGCKREPKTLVDIEVALEICKYGCQQCYRCPYENIMLEDEDSDEFCEDSVKTDALALIQQLQSENAEKAERIRVLENRNNALYHTILGVMHFVDKWLDVPAYDPDEDLNGTMAVGRASHAREIALQAIEQLEAERDAAVAGLKSNCTCPECKFFSDDIQDPCQGCKPNASKFEWRGVQKEE